MQESFVCRVVIDRPGRGTWNMAVDEALLEHAVEHGSMTLRLYQWREPTLSLGYFQPLAARHEHVASRQCPVVRRPSGGGAILHDREVTYSLAVPGGHPFARDAGKLYEVVHDAVIASLLVTNAGGEQFALARWDDTAAPAGSPEAFLCFQRRTAGDVVLRRNSDGPLGHKVVGSAQRRRQGAILQHGSILLHTSQFAPQLCGIGSLATGTWSWETTAPEVARTIIDALECAPHYEDLPAVIAARATQLEVEKYDTAAWLNRR